MDTTFKADDPVHFFYLLYVTKEQESIIKVIKYDYEHNYYPESKIICGKYLDILFEFSKSFFKISKHKIRAPFLLVGTNMHIMNLNIG